VATKTAPPKNPAKVKAGYAGSAARWKGKATRTVVIADLTQLQRELVIALVRAARAQAAGAEDAG
jgi:hypothetical protein